MLQRSIYHVLTYSGCITHSNSITVPVCALGQQGHQSKVILLIITYDKLGFEADFEVKKARQLEVADGEVKELVAFTQ